MGWVILSCNGKSQKSLIIDISPSNLQGQNTVESFINYIRAKDNSIVFNIRQNDYFSNI